MSTLDKQRKHKVPRTFGRYIALGIALGAGIGIALDNLVIGIAIGIVIGAALEVIQTSEPEKKPKDK